MENLLDGRRILILEDEYLAALDMSQMVEERGGVVVGPASRLDQALALVRSEPCDGAILDVRLDGDTSFPVADALMEAGVPVIFATGYDRTMLPTRFAATPKLAKPFTERGVERILRKVFAAGWTSA